MNPGVQALNTLVEMGILETRSINDVDQYFAGRLPNKREWPNVIGLLHKASSWCGTRGLSVTCGRYSDDVIYHYRKSEDKL